MSSLSNCRTFPSPPKRNMVVIPNSPLPASSGNHYSTFCFYGFACSWHFIYIEWYNIWPFTSGLFHVTCFKVHPCCGLYCTLLWLNNIPWHGSTIFCLSISWWTSELLPFFWLLGKFCCEHSCTHFCVDICFHCSWLYIQEWNLGVAWVTMCLLFEEVLNSF